MIVGSGDVTRIVAGPAGGIAKSIVEESVPQPLAARIASRSVQSRSVQRPSLWSSALLTVKSGPFCVVPAITSKFAVAGVGSTFPAGSVALTANTCVPTDRPV